MDLSLTDYVLWLASTFFQVGVLVAMYRRGLHREYPYFFNYTILQVVSEPSCCSCKGRHILYYYGYWVCSALCVLISFAVLQEIFKNAFRPYEALRDLSVILFRWSSFGSCAGRGHVGHHHHPLGPARHDHSDDPAGGSQRPPDAMRTGLLSSCFSVNIWASRGAMFCSVSRSDSVCSPQLTCWWRRACRIPASSHATVLRRINCAAYDLAVLIWLGYTALAPSRSACPGCDAVPGVEFCAGRRPRSGRGGQLAGLDGSYRRTAAVSPRRSQGERFRWHALID